MVQICKNLTTHWRVYVKEIIIIIIIIIIIFIDEIRLDITESILNVKGSATMVMLTCGRHNKAATTLWQ